MEVVETSREKEVDLVQIDVDNNPFLETVKTPSIMEDLQTKTSDTGLFLDTETKTSTDEESKMVTLTNPSSGFENTSPQAKTLLGKRTDYLSTSQEEIRKPRPNKEKQRKQNTQRQTKRPK
jgi:hypothetical protein